jgi:Big-like domain-containing protein
MRSHLLKLLPALVAAFALAAAPASAVETGVNETMDQNVPLGETAAGLGADWVRLWGMWESAEPSPGQYNAAYIDYLAAKVADAKRRGIKVLMIIGRTPAWASGGEPAIAPPSDPARFGAFMGEIARRIPGVDAWELWNEEDGPEFFLDGPQPGAYAAMVKAAYPAIKAAQPNDVVVTGGMVGNNMDFLEQLYDHGAQGSFDAVGVHTDTACLVNSPDVVYRDEKGRIGQYSFTGYREVHAVMSRHGDGAKPIWMTELGWNTQSTAPNSCSVGKWKGTKPLGVSEAQQAEFLTQAYRCVAADPFVQTALWFGIQDIPGSAHAAGFGLYRRDNSAKPAAAAFRALDGGIAPQPCGGVIDTSGPEIVIAKPTDGARFVEMFPIDAKAVEAPGGVGVQKIEIYADGKFSRSYGDGHALMRAFWPAREWKNGSTHTITFKGWDEADNTSSKTIRVIKVKRLPKRRTSASLALERLDTRTVRVTGAVTSPKARAAAKLRGKAVVVFQKRVAKSRWKPIHRIRRRASRPVDVTQRLAPGSWRVFLRYPGRKGFKKSRSKALKLRVGQRA